METNRKASKKWLVYTILIIGSLVMIGPFLWMILTSLKTISESTRIPMTIFPETARWQNYLRALDVLPFVILFYNTFVIFLYRV